MPGNRMVRNRATQLTPPPTSCRRREAVADSLCDRFLQFGADRV